MTQVLFTLLIACQPCQTMVGEYDITFEGELEGDGYLNFRPEEPFFYLLDDDFRREYNLIGVVQIEPPEGDRVYGTLGSGETLIGGEHFCVDRTVEAWASGRWSGQANSTGTTMANGNGPWEGYYLHMESRARGRLRLGGDWTLEHIHRVAQVDEVLGIYQGTFRGRRAGPVE
jgi:hypothetical protein